MWEELDVTWAEPGGMWAEPTGVDLTGDFTGGSIVLRILEIDFSSLLTTSVVAMVTGTCFICS